MDDDTKMLQTIAANMSALDIKYKLSPIEEQAALMAPLSELFADYVRYRIKLLKAGVITTKTDLQEMADITKEINAAADKQSMLMAIARTVAFIALRA